MMTFSKTLRTGMAAALLLAGISTGAQGFVPGGSGSFGEEARGAMQITGTVLCAGCNLDEVRIARPNVRKLYQLSHRQGQVVMQITMVNGSEIFDLGSPRLWVRAKGAVFQQLMAEENLAKEVKLTGILRTTHTLDIFEVIVQG